MASSKPKKSKAKKGRFVKKLTLFPLTVRQNRAAVFAVLMMIGIQMTLLSGWYYLYHQTVLSFKTTPTTITDAQYRAAAPTEIAIKKAGILLPITQAQIKDGVWETSDTTATHLATSSRPNEGSNIVIYGHNLKKLLGNLHIVSVGDVVQVTGQDGKVHEYVVESKTVVTPDKIEMVLPTDQEVLTVYTCTGFLDSKRLVVRATRRVVGSL